MITYEEFLESEIEEFESGEYQAEFNQSSDQRKNDILFKRLLFDYDEDLQKSLSEFIKTNGKKPAWSELILSYPELKYVITEPLTPMEVAKIVLKETSLEL